MEKLVEMKRERECRSEEKVGGKGSTEDSELQVNQREHSSMSPMSSPVNPISSLASPVSSPLSPLSSTGNQVQTILPSSLSPKLSGYLHYRIAEI